MKHYIKTGMMAIGILIAVGCQKSISEGTEGAEIAGSDPDNIPVYPRDVHGTVSVSIYPMEEVRLYLYDNDDEEIARKTYRLSVPQHSLDYNFCDKNINAYGHPYPWFVCVEVISALREEPAYDCSAPIYSNSFNELNCSPSRASAHRDISVSWNQTGYCVPNPCGN